MIVLAAPVFLTALAGYLAQSLLVKYATLALFAVLAVAFYCLMITSQGRALARNEQDILEAVSGRTEEI
jgi:purine-cytosine permease-like protein